MPAPALEREEKPDPTRLTWPRKGAAKPASLRSGGQRRSGRSIGTSVPVRNEARAMNGKRARAAVMRHGCRRGGNLRRDHRAAVGVREHRSPASPEHVNRGSNAANPMSGTGLQHARSLRPEKTVEVEEPRGRNVSRWPGRPRPEGRWLRSSSWSGRSQSVEHPLPERRTEEGTAQVNPKGGREPEPPSRWRASRTFQPEPRRWGEGEGGPATLAHANEAAARSMKTPRSRR